MRSDVGDERIAILAREQVEVDCRSLLDYRSNGRLPDMAEDIIFQPSEIARAALP